MFSLYLGLLPGGASAQTPKVQMNINQPGWVELRNEHAEHIDKKCALGTPDETEFTCHGVTKEGVAFEGWIDTSPSLADSAVPATFCGGQWLRKPCEWYKLHMEIKDLWICQIHSGYTSWTCNNKATPKKLNCSILQGRFHCGSKNYSFAKNSKTGNATFSVHLPGGKGWGKIRDLDYRGQAGPNQFDYPPTPDKNVVIHH